MPGRSTFGVKMCQFYVKAIEALFTCPSVRCYFRKVFLALNSNNEYRIQNVIPGHTFRYGL